MHRFDYEHMDVYKIALEFAAFAHKFVGDLPRGYGHIRDQLSRASASIVLNIAEGAGEYAKRDKARFYRMAKRSCTECSGILDLCVAIGINTAEDLGGAKSLLRRLVGMLTNLVRVMK